MPRVGEQQLARQAAGRLPFGADDGDVNRQRYEHDGKAGDRHGRGSAGSEPEERGLRHLNDHNQEKQRDAARGERLELAVAVGMIRVRRLLGQPQADERDDVRRAVGQRMKTVRENADGAAELAEDDLGQRDGEVQEQDADEDLANFGVTRLSFALADWRIERSEDYGIA